jgi:hypothetical protein
MSFMASILPKSNENKQTDSHVNRFLKESKISSFLHQCNIRKEAGISPLILFQFLFSLVLSGKNLYRTLDSGKADVPAKEDTVYRFLKNPTFNWRKFLVLLSSFLIKTKLLPLTSNDRERVLILDDSTYDRNRSKAVELLARVHDHTTGTFMKGFRMLTLGWSDGNTFMPLAFSLLSSDKKSNRYNEVSEKIDKRTVGYRRRKEAMQKSTETLFHLLDEVNPLQLCSKTLLFDSWFAFPSVIKRVVSNYPLHVICMLKNMHRVYYTYEGEKHTLSQLYKVLRKKRGRAKILASAIVSLGTDEQDNDIQARIIFVRDRNRSKRWLALLSTDLEVPDEEVVRLYGKRWQIECFFKVSKSHLRLAKEFQSQSYDALVAHTTIVFTRYIMLSISSREEEDPKTIGKLFYLCCDEIEDIRFIESLLLLIELLCETLSKELLITEEQIQKFLDTFFEKIPHYLKKTMKICQAA